MYITTNFGGNVHEAMVFVNTLKCRNHLFQVVALQPGCILIFKVVSREDLATARAELGLVDPGLNSGDLMAAMMRDGAGS